MKKVFLTSMLAMCMACPAFATDSSIAEGDMCTYSELNTYDGTANIEAIWTIEPRTCLAGKYYDKTTNGCLNCEAGSWCPGGTFDVEHNNTGDGKTGCSTLANGTYPNSLAFSDENTDCYRTCANGDIDNATAVSGNVYYNPNDADGDLQCSATACANGYHLQETRLYTNTTIATATHHLAHNENGCHGKDSNGTTVGGTGTDYTFGDCSLSEELQHFAETTDNNTWRLYFDNSSIQSIEGIATCETTRPSDGGAEWDDTFVYTGSFNPLSETGIWCWGKITKVNGQQVHSYWLGRYKAKSWANNADCERDCVLYIRNVIGQPNYDTWQRDALNSVYAKSCEANNIALKWYNENTEFVPENEGAEQCTYNTEITLPSTEPSKTGYTFGGWRFRSSTPANNNQQ